MCLDSPHFLRWQFVCNHLFQIIALNHLPFLLCALNNIPFRSSFTWDVPSHLVHREFISLCKQQVNCQRRTSPARSEWKSEGYIRVIGFLDGIPLLADGWAVNTITGCTS
jgi:hypothetical protein